MRRNKRTGPVPIPGGIVPPLGAPTTSTTHIGLGHGLHPDFAHHNSHNNNHHDSNIMNPPMAKTTGGSSWRGNSNHGGKIKLALSKEQIRAMQPTVEDVPDEGEKELSETVTLVGDAFLRMRMEEDARSGSGMGNGVDEGWDDCASTAAGSGTGSSGISDGSGSVSDLNNKDRVDSKTNTPGEQPASGIGKVWDYLSPLIGKPKPALRRPTPSKPQSDSKTQHQPEKEPSKKPTQLQPAHADAKQKDHILAELSPRTSAPYSQTYNSGTSPGNKFSTHDTPKIRVDQQSSKDQDSQEAEDGADIIAPRKSTPYTYKPTNDGNNVVPGGKSKESENEELLHPRTPAPYSRTYSGNSTPKFSASPEQQQAEFVAHKEKVEEMQKAQFIQQQTPPETPPRLGQRQPMPYSHVPETPSQPPKRQPSSYPFTPETPQRTDRRQATPYSYTPETPQQANHRQATPYANTPETPQQTDRRQAAPYAYTPETPQQSDRRQATPYSHVHTSQKESVQRPQANQQPAENVSPQTDRRQAQPYSHAYTHEKEKPREKFEVPSPATPKETSPPTPGGIIPSNAPSPPPQSTLPSQHHQSPPQRYQQHPQQPQQPHQPQVHQQPLPTPLQIADKQTDTLPQPHRGRSIRHRTNQSTNLYGRQIIPGASSDSGTSRRPRQQGYYAQSEPAVPSSMYSQDTSSSGHSMHRHGSNLSHSQHTNSPQSPHSSHSSQSPQSPYPTHQTHPHSQSYSQQVYPLPQQQPYSPQVHQQQPHTQPYPQQYPQQTQYSPHAQYSQYPPQHPSNPHIHTHHTHQPTSPQSPQQPQQHQHRHHIIHPHKKGYLRQIPPIQAGGPIYAITSSSHHDLSKDRDREKYYHSTGYFSEIGPMNSDSWSDIGPSTRTDLYPEDRYEEYGEHHDGGEVCTTGDQGCGGGSHCCYNPNCGVRGY